MQGYITLIVNQLETAGFFETRALLSMDILVSYLLLLPFLSILAIYFAMRKQIKLHQFIHVLLFFLTLFALSAFAYSVHYGVGFKNLLLESSIPYSTAYWLLVAHISIVVITLTLWMFVLLYAISDRKRRALPGVYSGSHARSGRRVLFGICLIALSIAGVYWMLFIA